MDNDDALVMWTVYDHPSDFPNNIVARKILITAGEVKFTSEVILSNNIERIRRGMHQLGFTQLPRNEDDDPIIVETWV